MVAFQHDDRVETNPPPEARLPDGPGGEIILVGTTEDEQRFMKRHNTTRTPH